MTPRRSRNRYRVYLTLGLLASALVGLMHLVTATTSSHSVTQKVQPSSKIGPRVLSATAGGQTTPIVILLSDQADVNAAYSINDQDARGWFVYNTLTAHATRTQAGLKEYLNSQGAAFQSFWAANMISTTANRQLVEALAARPDVARVDSNTPTRWIEEPEVEKSGVAASNPDSTEAVEWGVQNVNAPALWALGFTGQNIVIGGLDTGIRWSHNVLKPKYRGWNGSVADHNYNWRDAIHSGGGDCGPNTLAPCDDSGHGTHTVGTVIGDDGGGNQVGVAPGARWIGCRNMDQGAGTPATYTECFQFAIAPTDLAGNNPNPALRPHVLNNSWTCPASEGCVTRAELETIVNNTQAAGIFVAVSAGNAGPACSTISDPASIYALSFSVGATDINNALAGFSSRGPSTFYTPNLLKPNISAPGVNVRSATRSSDIAFSSLSGTSMAAPHVAGVVALLWSARPHLVRNIAATKALLQNTANPQVTLTLQTCGGISSSQIPNNSFGYGRVDALAAFNASAPVTVSGTVTSASGSPLPGVVMFLSGGASDKTITDSNGFYRFENVAVPDSYTIRPGRVNYHFTPEFQSLSLTGPKTDANFVGDSSTTPNATPIDTAEYFVRQHYLDFLNREPDHSGLLFWSDQILSCGGDGPCHERRRANVSAAFFVSIEFQETGYLVYRIYKSAYGNASPPVPVRFNEFLPDTQQIGQGVVVGASNWQNQLENNKIIFAQTFVARSRFTTAFPTTMSPTEFVNALYANAGVTPLDTERNSVIAEFGAATNTTDAAARARALRRVAENATLAQLEFNRAFVLMQYFGYLRRNPDDAPEPGLNYDGYNFWSNKLNQFNGNYIAAEMVKAFINSDEYRNRFPL
jgi:serine protease AprX